MGMWIVLMYCQHHVHAPHKRYWFVGSLSSIFIQTHLDAISSGNNLSEMEILAGIKL